MTAQTLPPGYKTAPWTPPEKITAAMLAEASGKLIELLRIRTQPIGMKLYEDPKDIEKIQGLRRPTKGFKFTMCQMVTQSRWYGFTLGIEVDNTRGGNCGGVVGLNDPGEDYLSGDNMNGVWFGNKEAAAAHQAQMPRVPHGKYNGLVVSPLRSSRLDPPDICLFYGTPGQMIYFINGLQYHRYRRYDFTVTGESACADSWGRALATRQTSLSLPCFAERRYGGVADDELLMACPPDELLRAIEGMGHLGKNGLRYPFPPYGAVMDPALGMAQELRLTMLYAVAWPLLSEADDTALRRLRAQYHPQEAKLIGPHFTLGLLASALEAEQVARIVERQHLPIRGRVEELALLRRSGDRLEAIATVALAR